MSKQSKKRISQSGFTLVELSIVLVIIGLVISSVLVGQDLVRSAELRATVTQYESFNAAVGTFRGKYGAIPGDVAGATNYGWTGDGDQNGVLIGTCGGSAATCAANTTATIVATSENQYFWHHLGSGASALISGSYTPATFNSTNISGILPAAKAGNYWGVFAGGLAPSATSNATAVEGGKLTTEAGTNYFILGVTGDSTGGNYTTAATLTPLEAKGIDDKIDDGKPSLGIIRARGAGTGLPDTVPTNAVSSGGSTSVCTYYVATGYTTAPATNTYVQTATTPLCTLRFKMVL